MAVFGPQFSSLWIFVHSSQLLQSLRSILNWPANFVDGTTWTRVELTKEFTPTCYVDPMLVNKRYLEDITLYDKCQNEVGILRAEDENSLPDISLFALVQLCHTNTISLRSPIWDSVMAKQYRVTWTEAILLMST